MPFCYRNDPATAKVLIGNSECTITSITTTQIECTTGPYPFSSATVSIQIFRNDGGLALNVYILLLLTFILFV